MPDEPVVSPIGDSLFASWPSCGVVIKFSRLTDHRDTLSAEVSVTHEHVGFLHWSRINLASATGRTGVVRVLDETHPGTPWRRMLDIACQRVAMTHRQAAPAVPLTAKRADPNRWLIDLWLPKEHTSVFYADGGVGKSLFALTLATHGLLGHRLGPWTIAPLARVLYLDWESDAWTHEDRLWGITSFLEDLPKETIMHRRMNRPILDDLPTVREDAGRYGPTLTIIDSLAPASGPEPEGADAAVRTLSAVDSLPGTKLILAHISKAGAESENPRPYGSVFNSNLARSTALLTKQASPDGFTLTFTHTKHNYSRQASPMALLFTFDAEGRIAVGTSVPDMRASGLGAQILSALRNGASTVQEIAGSTAATESAVRNSLHRLKGAGQVTPLRMVSGGRGNKSQWGLADRNHPEEPF